MSFLVTFGLGARDSGGDFSADTSPLGFLSINAPGWRRFPDGEPGAPALGQLAPVCGLGASVVRPSFAVDGDGYERNAVDRTWRDAQPATGAVRFDNRMH